MSNKNARVVGIVTRAYPGFSKKTGYVLRVNGTFWEIEVDVTEGKVTMLNEFEYTPPEIDE